MITKLTDVERQRIRIALVEDTGKGDPTTLATVPEDMTGRAVFLAKQNGVLAGVDIARQTFEIYEAQTGVFSPVFDWQDVIEDGGLVEAGQEIGVLRASMRTLLTAERVALNLLQRMSGIATLTRKFVDAVIAIQVGKMLNRFYHERNSLAVVFYIHIVQGEYSKEMAIMPVRFCKRHVFTNHYSIFINIVISHFYQNLFPYGKKRIIDFQPVGTGN